MNYKLIDEHGRQLDAGAAWCSCGPSGAGGQAGIRRTARDAIAYAKLPDDWTFGELPELMEVWPGPEGAGATRPLRRRRDGEPQGLRRPGGGGKKPLRRLAPPVHAQFKDQVKYFDKNVPVSRKWPCSMALGSSARSFETPDRRADLRARLSLPTRFPLAQPRSRPAA